MTPFHRRLAFGVCSALLCVSHAAEVSAVDFIRDVAPILQQHCYSCHGAEKQKAGLRLDRRANALRGGDSGKVIVPGQSVDSVLMHNVTGRDPDLVMPPEGETRLSEAEIGTLRRWIDAGAPWPETASAAQDRRSNHWAFRAPVKAPTVFPADAPAEWRRSAIDAFVLARLKTEQMAPSPEADRPTLIRRLSLDLVGLPPTPAEVIAFAHDPAPNAYERAVDRLLASQHFGERWGRHWLDLARYADSDGYEKDGPRPYAYLFRDWVIQAVNRDLPFDRFTVEQLAGDLLPEAKDAERIATGFHRQTLTNKEGGVDKEEFRTKAVVDRVSTTGTTWLGLTVGCAECHSHKFDPISQREFFQLYAFFNDASEKDIPMPQPSELETYTRLLGGWEPKAKELDAQLAERRAGVAEDVVTEWANAQTLPTAKWAMLRPSKAKIAVGDGETELTPARDGVITPRLRDTTRGRFVLEATTALKRVTGFRVEAIEELGRPIGRGAGGDFVLAEFTAAVRRGHGESEPLKFAAARADFAVEAGGASEAIDGKVETGWSVASQTDRPHVIVFELSEPLTLEEGQTLVFELDQSTTGVMNRFRLGATGSAGPLEPSILPEPVLAALRVNGEQRTEAQRGEIVRHYVEHVDDAGRKLRLAIAAHAARKPRSPETTAAILVPEERKTHIHIRGDFLRPGDAVQPGTLEILPGLQARGAKPDRLDLAQWLVDPRNPLTARVAVNHVWKNLFGRALVGTVDDFGTRGELPSHPELLDWLAVHYQTPVAQGGLGWSRKALIKLIVSSATYRQSSRTRAELVGRDPNNVLLARQNRFRLEAETVRDAFLAASGLLNPAVGGPSIRPQLPADIAALGYANSVKWQESTGADRYRRGMYIFFQRTVPYPMLMTFDAPDSNVSCTRRERSNTPLQALTLLNDPVFFECAQALARRVTVEAGASTAVQALLQRAFEHCVARTPTADELRRLQELYEGHLKLVRVAPEAAAKIVGQADSRDLAEQAAFVAVCRLMLNLDEFLTRE